MKKFKIGNLIIFGESYSKMILNELDKLQINATTEFHVLRHFSYVDPGYAKTLIGREYFYYDHNKGKFVKSIITLDDIQDALNTKGTKFFNDVKGIENPKKLLECIKAHLEEKIKQQEVGWIQKKNRRTSMFMIKYDQEVGWDSMVPISSLTKEEQERIKIIPRSEHEGDKSLEINTITGVEKKSTRFISVEIDETDALPFYSITAYPSEMGPDFPNLEQDQEEYEYNKKYWDGYVTMI